MPPEHQPLLEKTLQCWMKLIIECMYRYIYTVLCVGCVYRLLGVDQWPENVYEFTFDDVNGVKHWCLFTVQFDMICLIVMCLFFCSYTSSMQNFISP